MKKITACLKRSLPALILIFLLAFPAVSFAYTLSVEGGENVEVNTFIDIDPYSIVDLSNSQSEVGIWRDVRVKVVDRLGHPIPGHHIVLYSSSNALIFQQPSKVTDADGYARGRVRSFSPGAYTIKAKDTTYSTVIAIQDTASLYIFPVPIPRFKPEPYYTPGTSNTLYWDKVTGFVNSYDYKIEVATDSNFANIVKSTAWITGTQIKFEGLVNAQMYFYRIRSRNTGGGESSWSNVVFSVQDAIYPVIKQVTPPKFIREKKNLTIQFKFNVTDNLALKEVRLYCDNPDGLKKCGWLQSTGSNYSATILIDELEKDKMFNFKDNYSFCVEAEDEAGNTTKDCNFKLKFESNAEIPAPIFVNIINSIINSFNDALSKIDGYISFMLQGISGFSLSLISGVLLLISLLISFNVLLGSIALIPAMISYRFMKLWSLFGFRKHGTPLGIVYDSITKKPVRYAKVYIYDSNNFLLRKDVTYYDGIFTADLDIGRYRIIVQHGSYLFPSNIVKKSPDEEYRNVYKGEDIVAGRRRILNLSIPLDPKNIILDDEKKLKIHYQAIKFLKHFNVLLTTIGFLFSVYALQRDVNILNLLLVLMYIPVFGVYLKGIVHFNIGMK